MIVTIKNGDCMHANVHHYPDGQKNVTLDMEWFNNPKELIEIKCNVRNFSDLEILLCVVSALRKEDFFIGSIHFNYLFGMRSDRSFEAGMPNYFRDVIAPIINSLNIPQITFLQPHSFISQLCIKNTHLENYRIYDALARSELFNSFRVGGDESFSLWGYNLNANFFKLRVDDKVELRLNRHVIQRMKHIKSEITVIDDLCDGGATFIAASAYLKENFPDIKINLFVIHGLFTKGIEHVAAHFDKIFTTNSYQEFKPHPKVEVVNVWND